MLFCEKAHFIRVYQQNTESTNYLNTWRSLSPAKLLVCEGTSTWCSCCTQQKSTARNILLTLAFHLIGSRRSARSLSVCLSSVRVQEKLITAKSGSIAVKHCSEQKRNSSKSEKNTRRSDSDVLLSFRVLIPPHMPWNESLLFLSPTWWVKTTSGANRQGDKRQSYSNRNMGPTTKMELKERATQMMRYAIRNFLAKTLSLPWTYLTSTLLHHRLFLISFSS